MMHLIQDSDWFVRITEEAQRIPKTDGLLIGNDETAREHVVDTHVEHVSILDSNQVQPEITRTLDPLTLDCQVRSEDDDLLAFLCAIPKTDGNIQTAVGLTASRAGKN